jgi:Ca2+-binding RTX toxin-like protein
VDYSNSPTGVTVDLTNNSASGGWATGDVISGFENVIGSSHGGNTLTGASGGGSTLVGGSSGSDTLVGAGGDNVLIDLGATDTMTGGAGGNNLFVFENPLSGHIATITDFVSSDEIVVNVADQAYTPQTGGSILASQYFSGPPSDTHVNDSFFVQQVSSAHYDVWFSANGIAANAIDIAHVATGVAPTAAQIHTH